MTQLRQPLARVTLLMALALMSVAAFLYSVGGQDYAHLGDDWTLLGFFLLGVALILYRRHSDDAAVDTQPTEAVRQSRWQLRPIPVIAGIILLVIFAEISGNFFDPSPLDGAPSWVQLLLWIAGPLLMGWGFAGGNPVRAVRRLRPDWVLILIIIIAFAVTAYDLDAIPYFVDEVHFANPVTHFWAAPDVELLLPFSSVAAFPYLYPYFQWFGVNVLGRTFEGLRIVSVLFGTLNVLALYLLARALFGRRVALMAALLLAVFPPHLQFSRLALNNIADPFFGMMTFVFILRGLRRNSTADFAWAGVFLGYTQYFYEGGRLLYPVLVGVWFAALFGVGFVAPLVRESHDLINSFFSRKQNQKRHLTFDSDQTSDSGGSNLRFFGVTFFAKKVTNLSETHLRRGMVVMVLVAVFVGMPVYYTIAGEGEELAARMQSAGVTNRTMRYIHTPGALFEHFQNRFYESYLIHVALPEASLYYAGETALILGVVLPFFLTGLALLLWRFYTPAATLILLWIGLTWLGNTLLQESRISARYVVAFPAVVMVIAVGVDAVVNMLLTSRRARNLTVFAAVMALAALQVTYFYGTHIDTFNAQFVAKMRRDAHDALIRGSHLPPDTDVYLIGDPTISSYDARVMMHYLQPAANVLLYSKEEFDEFSMQLALPTRNQAYFVQSDDLKTISMINSYFPTLVGPIFSERDLPPEQQYVLYFVPADRSQAVPTAE